MVYGIWLCIWLYVRYSNDCTYEWHDTSARQTSRIRICGTGTEICDNRCIQPSKPESIRSHSVMGPCYNMKYLWAGYYGKKLVFLLQRTPSFDDQYVRQLESTLNTLQGTGRKFVSIGKSNEIDHYKQSSFTYIRQWTISLMAIFLFHLAKDMMIQIIDYNLVDRVDLGSNIYYNIDFVHNTNESEIQFIFKFACLVTNCTQLSSENPLGLDMSRLPHFKLCVPYLSRYYNSVILVDPMALLTFTTVAFGVILVSVIHPLWNLISPFQKHMLMFYVAPTIVTNVLQRDLRYHLEELNLSWSNFVNDWQCRSNLIHDNQPPNTRYRDQINDLSESFESYRLTHRTDRTLCSARSNYLASSSNLSHSPVIYTDDSFRPIDRNKVDQDYLDECLPAIRTDWWRFRIARAFLLVSSLATTIAFSCFSLLFKFLDRRADMSKALYKQFSREMDRTGCKIWADPGGEGQIVTVDLTDQDIEWNFWTGIDLFLNYLLTFCFAILVTNLWIDLLDLQCWLHEILDFCKFSLQMVHDIDLHYNINAARFTHRDSREVAKIPDGNRYSSNSLSSVCTGKIRKDFMRRSCVGLYYWNEKCTDYKVIDSIQCLLEDPMDIDGITEFVYETLEKYYLSLRLFLTYMDKQERVLIIVALISYPLNYGAALLCVVHVRQTNSFGIEPIMIISVGMLIANVFILVPSHFNAKVSNDPHIS